MRPRPLCRAFAVCLAKTHFPCGLERLRQIHRDSRRGIHKNNKAVANYATAPCGAEWI